MNTLFENYIQSISAKFYYPETSEMGYRADFEALLKGIFSATKVKRIDHDARSKKGNKPDFVIYEGDLPLLHIEAKDIGVSLDKVEKSEQMARYFGYDNLVLTDYLEFRFYRNGKSYERQPIKIATYDLENRKILPLPENFDHLKHTLIDFAKTSEPKVDSGEHLAKIMGGKAQRIRENVRQFFAPESSGHTEVKQVFEVLKKLLVHDLTAESFADMYAQTLVYGLFVARYYDLSPKDFTRQKARELVPKSNPFLGHFFDHISGRNFDTRLSFIVDELCEVFKAADVHQLMEQYFEKDLFGKETAGPDPVIHFYEDFLKEYDPELRKRMGAYYTPLPVVRFIIRSVDAILEKDFGLKHGLADTAKLASGLHRVQVLDPAVGTGTFISAVIRNIYERILRENQKGTWPSYVHHELLPRIHGFELMMAPYTIAHLKLSMEFQKSGFKYFNDTRLGIYLTNSLEESVPQMDLLAFDFGAAIAEEAKEASIIKNKTPIMIVVGNPPYSGSSANETKYANSLVEKYKVEPGGNIKLRERKHWLNDDYVKFIALAESTIEKNGDGVLGFITNHGYLDNPTFRGMRWHLRRTFDKIYILDLHGNSRKKEKSPDGSKDENVFDIMSGVSIMLGVRTSKESKNKKLATVYFSDLYGIREVKFETLEKLTIANIAWAKLPENCESWKIEGKDKDDYDKGFSIEQAFVVNCTGICSQRDLIAMRYSREDMSQVVRDFSAMSERELSIKYKLEKDGRDWTLKTAKQDVINTHANIGLIAEVEYRPFDTKFTYFTAKSKGFIAYPRGDVMKHIANRDNLVLNVGRQGQVVGPMPWNIVFATKRIVDLNCFYRGGEQVFPLYLYAENGTKTPNLKNEVVVNIQKVTGATVPEDIFDYIYAVLHSPNYRERYKEFLKTDFPNVPYPRDAETFASLVKLGRELRGLHLLESPVLNKPITSYNVPGSDTVEKIVYKAGKVCINTEQYFGDVPEVAWNFYIGGYQPAQKWLKDRKGRTLTSEDISHYQKIIMALTETARIMKEIDTVKI